MSTGKDVAIVPENIPAYLATAGLAREMNADAAAGISTGFPPSIRIKNGKFRLVDGAGEEEIVKPSQLVEGQFLDMVVLRAKPGLNKVWYAKPYDPSAEASAPDCFSLDGIKPDPSVQAPQCANCASCPQNAWGSGRNQAGEATKGKACNDNKILAVLYKGGVYQFKIPPASLKNWAVFVKNLSARDVPLGGVVIYVSFDDDSDFSVLKFRVGGFIPEAAIPKLMEYVSSPEVAEIVQPTVPANPPANQPGREVEHKPEPTPPPVDVADVFGEDKPQSEPTPTQTVTADATLTELRARASELKIKGRSKMDADELADAISDAEAAMAKPEPEPEPAQEAKPEPAQQAATNAVPSDDDIVNSLGL